MPATAAEPRAALPRAEDVIREIDHLERRARHLRTIQRELLKLELLERAQGAGRAEGVKAAG
jgi:hypothetical protein